MKKQNFCFSGKIFNDNNNIINRRKFKFINKLSIKGTFCFLSFRENYSSILFKYYQLTRKFNHNSVGRNKFKNEISLFFIHLIFNLF